MISEEEFYLQMNRSSIYDEVDYKTSNIKLNKVERKAEGRTIYLR